MPGLRRDGLPGSFNLPKQLRMSPSPIELSRIILGIPIMVLKNLQAPARQDGNSYPRQATATSNWLSCQGWQVHGMDLGPRNASRMDHFKSSGRVPHERRDLHALRPFILTLLIDIVMIHVRIFILLLHSQCSVRTMRSQREKDVRGLLDPRSNAKNWESQR